MAHGRPAPAISLTSEGGAERAAYDEAARPSPRGFFIGRVQPMNAR